MKFDFVVLRIEASQDGSPYVYVKQANPNDYKAGAEKGPSFNPFGVNTAAFTSEDLMNNLPKTMTNVGKAMGGGGSPTDSRPVYEDMSIKAGSKVTIEIKKAESSGI